MIGDFHAHSHVSDGTHTPSELVALAAEAGVSVLALTDHDDLAGIPEAQACAHDRGLELMTGVEISVAESERQMHILGLGVDSDDPQLMAMLSGIRDRRQRRAERIVGHLRELGVELESDAVQSVGAIGRVHIARALVAAGACGTIDQAFRRFIGRGRPAYEPSAGVEAREAIGRIHDAGGIASLAHPPMSAGVDAPGGLESFVERLAREGLDAVEIQHPGVKRPQRKRLRKIARQFGLIETGGSDFHGDTKPGVRLGHGRSDIRMNSKLCRGIRDAIDAR
jgi:predicted metal-dependent phosphoesterase TrpH